VMVMPSSLILLGDCRSWARDSQAQTIEPPHAGGAEAIVEYVIMSGGGGK